MDSCASRVLDSMDRDGFVRTLSRFGQIYDKWTRAWIHRLVQRVVQRQRNIIIMDDNYTGNGSNNANGFQIDRYFLDTCSAYNSSHSKQSNAQKQQ
jgi:hypothetical protein